MVHANLATAAVLATTIAAGAALVVVPAAEATTHLTATGTRIADHPGFVRAAVDFADGEIPPPSETLRATAPEPLPAGAARVPLDQRRLRTAPPPPRAH